MFLSSVSRPITIGWPVVQYIYADSFTRLFCTAVTIENLYKLHDSLCHPGVTRFHHFLKVKNIAASLEEFKAH